MKKKAFLSRSDGHKLTSNSRKDETVYFKINRKRVDEDRVIFLKEDSLSKLVLDKAKKKPVKTPESTYVCKDPKERNLIKSSMQCMQGGYSKKESKICAGRQSYTSVLCVMLM